MGRTRRHATSVALFLIAEAVTQALRPCGATTAPATTYAQAPVVDTAVPELAVRRQLWSSLPAFAWCSAPDPERERERGYGPAPVNRPNATARTNPNNTNKDASSVVASMPSPSPGGFDGPLRSWDVSRVTTMASLFAAPKGTADAYAFEEYGGGHGGQDLADWGVGSVTNMTDMFRGARGFNGNVSAFDTSAVVTMRGMFNGAAGFNGDISQWASVQ
jgi:hypothetical protein